jgi:hypothetical protein
MSNEENIKQSSSWFILVFITMMIPAGLLLPQWIGLGLTWMAVAILMLLTICFTGLSLGKGCAGALIDPKTNMMSLSRLQIMLWTWVILSAFITLALARISNSHINPDAYGSLLQVPGMEVQHNEPLLIHIPQLLWALMGISITSAVASPLLKTAKAQKTSDQDESSQQRATKRGGPQQEAVTYRAILDERKRDDEKLKEQIGDSMPLGAIVRKDTWQKAKFSDVLTGEEVSTFGYVDIAKVQNLFFTVIAVVAYSVALVSYMSGTKSIDQLFAFPELPAGLVAIIGISHGGYLIDKAVTHSTPIEGTQKQI